MLFFALMLFAAAAFILSHLLISTPITLMTLIRQLFYAIFRASCRRHADIRQHYFIDAITLYYDDDAAAMPLRRHDDDAALYYLLPPLLVSVACIYADDCQMIRHAMLIILPLITTLRYYASRRY